MKKASTLILISLFSHFLLADINGGYSIELSVLHSHTIITGKILNTSDSSSVFDKIQIGNIKVLKGEYTNTTFDGVIYKSRIGLNIQKYVSVSEKGDYLVLFLDSIPSTSVRLHFNLSQPKLEGQTFPAPISQNMKLLNDSTSLMELITDRVNNNYIDKNFKLKKVKFQPFYDMQGYLIIQPTGEVNDLLYNFSSTYLVVAPDLKYRKMALEYCNSEYDSYRIEGAKMLKNYSDNKTIEMLNSLLTDPYNVENCEDSESCYPVRVAAKKSLNFIAK